VKETTLEPADCTRGTHSFCCSVACLLVESSRCFLEHASGELRGGAESNWRAHSYVTVLYRVCLCVCYRTALTGVKWIVDANGRFVTIRRAIALFCPTRMPPCHALYR
jgi:hypothetical protein